MKIYRIAAALAAAMLYPASADVLFVEDFESVSISSDTAISVFGWANDIHQNDARVYDGNAVWSWGSTAYTEAFYTTQGMGAGFTPFDLSAAPDLRLSVDNHSTWSPEVTAGYFALQMNGSEWYVSTTPVATATGVWTTREAVFDPTAYLWNTLTVSGTGSVGAGGAAIGLAAPADLSGTVTGVGFVVVRTGNGTHEFDNLTLYTPTITTPPAAPTITKLWMNGTTAKLYWGHVISATNYVVKAASSSGGPYTPVADTTNNTFWVTNLVVGSTNYFVVAAENEAGEGDPSAQVSGVARDFTIIADSDISWGDWLPSYKEAAFDGNTSTFYESPNAIGSYVGVDFGEGNATIPLEILYHPTVGKTTALLLGAQFQGSDDGLTWDTLITIPAQPTVAWHSVYPDTTNAYRFIRLWFADGNDSNHGTVAEIAFGTNVPPFHDITVTPVNGSAFPGPTNVTLSAQIVDWSSEFSSGELYLNDALVASSGTPSASGTNLLSYATGSLDTGSYTGKVVVTGINPPVVVTNTWTFSIVSTPSPTALMLWNINMAGSESSSFPVPGGTIIKAPSTGGNQWNNLVSPLADGIDTNEFTWLPTNALEIVDAGGANPIGLMWSGADLDWRYQPETITPADDLFKGYFGSSGFNNTMQISGLDPAGRYDIYVYFTWQWNENQVTYTITEGSGDDMSAILLPERDYTASGTYADLVRGRNYVIFSQLSPSLAGNIHINAASGDGGWSGLQIAKVPGSGPSISPDIQSIALSGGTVTLQWASESGISYTILRKNGLTEANWTAVKAGIAGSDSWTADSVPAGGTENGFFRIQGD